MVEIDEKRKVILDILEEKGKLERKSLFNEISRANENFGNAFKIKKVNGRHISSDLANELMALTWTDAISLETSINNGRVEEVYNLTNYGRDLIKKGITFSN